MVNRVMVILKVRRCCLFLAVLCVLVLPTHSQAEIQSLDDIVTKMKTELKLTQRQSDAVKPIIQEYRSGRKQLIQNFRKQGLTDKDALKNQIGQLKSVEKQKLGQILTQDQMNKWIEKENFNAMLNPDSVDDSGNTGRSGGHRHRHSSEDANEDSFSGTGE